MDMEFKGFKAKKRNVSVPRVRWWNLTRENATKLSNRIKSEASWKVTEDSDAIREGMAQCIRRSAKEVLGISRRGGGRKSEVWWQNEEVRERELRINKMLMPPLAIALQRKKKRLGRLRTSLPKS